ncbi:MAG: hypothetical protein WD934_07365 [Gemmatimonadales bacterium]
MKWLPLLAVGVACGGSGDQQAETQPVDTVVADAELVMPAIPEAARGRLAVASAGPLGLSATFRARAGRCTDPSSLQIAVHEPLEGIMLLVIIPADDDSLVVYPIVRGDALPAAPSARAGVQRIVDHRPYSWRAGRGEVTLTEWAGNLVSGTFTLTVQATDGFDEAMMAGAFRSLPVTALDSLVCRPSTQAPTR